MTRDDATLGKLSDYGVPKAPADLGALRQRGDAAEYVWVDRLGLVRACPRCHGEAPRGGTQGGSFRGRDGVLVRHASHRCAEQARGETVADLVQTAGTLADLERDAIRREQAEQDLAEREAALDAEAAELYARLQATDPRSPQATTFRAQAQTLVAEHERLENDKRKAAE
jgi:hypothetical protein